MPESKHEKDVNQHTSAESDNEDGEIFHDARFPADEEAVSLPAVHHTTPN